MKKDFNAIDFLKFVFCFAIIAIHTSLFHGVGNPLSRILEIMLLRIAVPFFFVASGFFLGRKIVMERRSKQPQYWETIISYVKRLLKPYLVFLAINLVQECILQIYARHALNIIDITQHLFFYPYGALWYVWASVVGALCLYPFLSKNRISFGIIIGAVLYTFALLCNNYGFLIQGSSIGIFVNRYMEVFLSPRNGIFVGFFFLSIGVKLAEIDLVKIGLRNSWLIFAVIYGLYVAEAVLLNNKPYLDDGSLLIMSGPLASVFLILALHVQIPMNKKTSILLRNLSTGVYFIHRPILWFVVRVLPSSGLIPFIVTSVLSIGICLVVYHSGNKHLCALLR